MSFFKWAPDYIVEGPLKAGEAWWKDDDLDFNEQAVRPTSFRCDFLSTTGAVLFDTAWMTEVEMENELLDYARKITANPANFSFPGWRSVSDVILFLRSEAQVSSAIGDMLKSFLADINAQGF